ncbi:hypothetical protein BaRGS_00018455 [Batillaria attramentaria]|uniref:Uncharacterized protein n=1 Tax=Batillaria attramentaria TaxID=370345 RepID=A0ABD0KST0_9CAEN
MVPRHPTSWTQAVDPNVIQMMSLLGSTEHAHARSNLTTPPDTAVTEARCVVLWTEVTLKMRRRLYKLKPCDCG